MRKLLIGLIATMACLAVPSVCAAATSWDASKVNLGIGQGLIAPATLATRPPGFATTAGQAIVIAKTSPVLRALHAQLHPLILQAEIAPGALWQIEVGYHGRKVAEADITPSGRILHVWTGPLAIAPYARGDYAPTFGSVWVLLPFCAMFLLIFVDPRRLLRAAHVDALALLSLMVSYGLFAHTHLEAAVWTVYPPLLYLLARMLWVGLRGEWRGYGLSGFLSTRTLIAGLVALVAARTALSLANHTVLDVGYASVIGASRITHGLSIYWAGAQHGDTYGPIAYLAYVPFELIFPWHGSWDYLASAHVASLFFDLVTVAGLIRLGTQLRRGTQGLRLGLALAWAWCACPFTLLGLMMHSNDGLIAMLSVLALVAFSSPAARGALIGLAAAAKFSPAALLPLFASRRDRGRKSTLIAVTSFAVIVIASIGLYLPPGGLSEFYNHTLGFQFTRTDVFSPWALHPGLAPIKDLLALAAVLLAGAVAFVPRRRTLTQVCAMATAVTIAVQLPAIHWFYYYVIWFVPFMFVPMLAGASEGIELAPIEASAPLATPADAPEPEPVAVA